MITKTELPKIAMQNDRSLKRMWIEFLKEYKDEEEVPCYVFAGNCAHHVYEAFYEKYEDQYKNAFRKVENILCNCDEETRGIMVVGFLEALQNTVENNGNNKEEIEKEFGKSTKEWWDKLTDFWTKGIPLQ